MSGEKEGASPAGSSSPGLGEQRGDTAGPTSLGIRIEKATSSHQPFFLQISVVSMQHKAGHLVHAELAVEDPMVRGRAQALAVYQWCLL